MEVATKNFRLLRVKECDINTTMCLKCGKCLKVATFGHFVSINLASKTWKQRLNKPYSTPKLHIFHVFKKQNVEAITVGIYNK